MKQITLLLTTTALLVGLNLNAADNNTIQNQRRIQTERRAEKLDIDKRIQAINRLDNKESAKIAGLAAISKETAVPLPDIQAEVAQHSNVGLAGIFVAHELATQTHKPVAQFIRQRQAGKTWTEIATANGEDLTTMDAKLVRIEEAMRNPGAVSSGTATTDRTAVREREVAVTSSLDRRIDALNTQNNKPVATQAGLAAVSKETAVPLPALQETQKQNTSAGLGDLFIAQDIGLHTQKPIGDLLKLHADGKSWSQIARDHNQDVAELEKKLDRVEQAVRDAGQ